MTKDEKQIIIDYYFKHPSAKAVLEDSSLEVSRLRVEDLLEEAYHLVDRALDKGII
jgi:hypothetical protein